MSIRCYLVNSLKSRLDPFSHICPGDRICNLGKGTLPLHINVKMNFNNKKKGNTGSPLPSADLRACLVMKGKTTARVMRACSQAMFAGRIGGDTLKNQPWMLPWVVRFPD